MFLKENKKAYKGKEYITYTLTESYREDGKVKHRNVSNLGSLTEEQAERIRLVLKAKQTKDILVLFPTLFCSNILKINCSNNFQLRPWDLPH